MSVTKHFEIYGLSPRETEVAALVARGLSNKEVANILFVTEKTVKFHCTNLFKKMKLKSRAQLIVATIPFIQEETRLKAEAQKAREIEIMREIRLPRPDASQ